VSIASANVGFIEPMLALAVTKLPEGPAWAYELKFDGYRALGLKASGRVRILSRNGKDFTKRFASIASALEALPDETMIDGEVIAYGADGRPSFNVCGTIAAPGPSKPVVRYKSFLYQAASWRQARRVMAKVEFHGGELFPRVGSS
jgi:hypothetical protein